MKAYAPNGLEIVATLETIPGKASVDEDSFNRDSDGKLTFEYDSGGTDIDWNGQMTVNRAGGRVFIDSDDNEWTEDQIIISETPLDPLQKINEFLEWLRKADVYQLAGSPILMSYDETGLTGEYTPDDQIVFFSWVDDFGDKLSVIFTQQGIIEGKWISWNEIQLDDHEGEPHTITAYKLADHVFGGGTA